MKKQRDLQGRIVTEVFAPMIAILEEDARQALTLIHYDPQGGSPRLFLSGEGLLGDTVELMLRLNTREKKLVVARIQLDRIRMGFGTRLLEAIRTYGKAEGYETIVFESVLTDRAKAFLRKHGFHPQYKGENEVFDWVCPL